MTGHDSYPRLVHKYGKEWWVPINDLRAEICTKLSAPAVEPYNNLREHCKQYAEMTKDWPESKQNCLGGTPAPVAHTMKSVMSAVCAITGFPMLTSNQCHALAQSLNACLDTTAALNKEK